MGRPSKPHRTSLGYWRCRIDGRQYHLGKNEREARAKFHELMAKANRRTGGDPLTVARLILLWLDLHPSIDHEYRLRDLGRFAGRKTIAEIDARIIEDYHRFLTRRKPELAPKTIIDRVRIAARVLRWAAEQDWIDKAPPVPRMRRPVRRARDIRPNVLRSVFAELPDRVGRLATFILTTGCRPIEACQLRWEDVELDAGVCILHRHKTADATGRPRTLYLPPETLEILRSIKRRSGYVFLSRLGKPYTTAGLRLILKRRGITPYQLRHTFAQNASEQLPEEVLAKLMGHSNRETTRFYYEVRDERAKAAVTTLVSPLVPDSPGPQRSAEPTARRKRRARTVAGPRKAKPQES